MKKYIVSLSVFFLVGLSLTLSVNADYTDRIDSFMQALAVCESGGNEKALNPNDGGTRSVGILQFKDATFRGFMKRFSFVIPPASIWDAETQMALARRMILEPQGWRHWKNCSLQIGLLPHMAF